MTGGRAVRWLSVVALSALWFGTLQLSAPAAEAATGDITLFGATVPVLGPGAGIVTGPDNQIWFTDTGPTPDAISELNPSTGVITQHPVTGLSSPQGITVGGDGNIWFSSTITNKIGRYNPTTDEVQLFNSPVVSPGRLTTAADGTIWVLGSGNNASQVLLNGNAGVATPNLGSASDIVLGPDNNIWISRVAGANLSLVRVNPTTGAIVEFDAPSGVLPHQLTVGPDNNLWLTYLTNGAGFGGVARFVVSTGAYTLFPFAADRGPGDITAGSDGNLWFTTTTVKAVNRITTTGTGSTSFTFANAGVMGRITSGPDDNVWFTHVTGVGPRIGRAKIEPPSCNGLPVTVDIGSGQTPTNGNDVILGTAAGETINALNGNDTICSSGGGDTVNAGDGNDFVNSGQGNDTVNAGIGADTVKGVDGTDTLKGDAGNDNLDGGAGNDRLVGGTNTDICKGGAGTDTQSGCETRTGIP